MVFGALIIRDPKSGQSKGYGFITFTSKHSYDSALAAETVILGRKADCHAVMTKSSLKEKIKQDVNNKIFVGGISQSTKTDHLLQYFSRFGKVLDARILYDGNTGMSRGFGFVLFEKKEATEKLFSEPGEHKIKGKRIECKLFENKNSKVAGSGRRKRKASQHSQHQQRFQQHQHQPQPQNNYPGNNQSHNNSGNNDNNCQQESGLVVDIDRTPAKKTATMNS